MAVVFGNHARSTLASGINAVTTSLTIAAGEGSRFPTITAPDIGYLHLDNGTTREICKITAHGVGSSSFTIERGQDGTTAAAWPSGTIVEMRLCKAIMDTFLQTADFYGQTFSQSFIGDGSTTDFTLYREPGGGGSALNLYVNGTYQQRSTYTVTGTTLSLTTAPALNDDIEAVWFQTTEILTADSSAVTYDPAGTGAVATTVQAKLREWVSVKDFGAVGDGVTDDTSAIQAAIDAHNQIEFPDGTYYLANNLSVSKDVKLFGRNATLELAASKQLIFLGAKDAGANPSDITANDASITVATAFDKGDVLWIEGDDSTSPAANLTLSTITLGAAVTVTASASVFVSGDVGKVILTDSETGSLYITGYSSGTSVSGYISNNNAPSGTSVSSGSWKLRTNFCPSRPYYERGELGRVFSYSGGAATMESPVIETYTGLTTNIYKLTTYKVEMRNIKVTGSYANDGLVKGTYLADSVFENVEVINDASTGNGIYLTKCWNVDVINCQTDADQYSTLIHGCQNIRVRGGNHLSNSAHAIEVSGGMDTPPSRRVFVVGATATSRQELYAINTHGGTSDVSFKDCTALGGAAVYGQRQSVENCTVTMGTAARIALRLYPEVSGSYINALGNTVLGGIGINYRENFAAVGATDVLVQGNTVVGGQGFTLDVVSGYDAVPFATKSVSVIGNDMTASNGNCVTFDAGSKSGTGTANHMQAFRVVGNANLKSTSTDGVYVRGNYKLVNLTIATNRIECAAGQDGFDVANVRNVVIVANNICGAGAGGSSNKVAPTVDSVVCTNNSIFNFTTDLGLNISNTSDRRNNIIANNQFDTVAGSLPSYVRYPFLRFNNNQNVWATGTAIPTGGTYTQGDIVWNSAGTKDGSNMTLLGWYRLTTGSNHVSGTDWALMYVSHVSPAT